ncbi:hypothetical protein KW803_00405 [Candidatus Saccharibacteria bacterium]|nr:hypothetical protein [Candidatus Saccharibacteria bacterium]
MINVAIMQGWAGGKWNTREFEAALAAAGYNVTPTLHADVIIAHSTACYDLPAKTSATYFVLIDPPYWPGKSIVKRMLDKKKFDTKLAKQALGWKAVAQKTFWEIVYIFAKPKYTQIALQHNSQLTFLEKLKEKNVGIIHNENDYLCSPDIQVPIASYPNVKFIRLPGGHDDYYTNPQPYIDLLPKSL